MRKVEKTILIITLIILVFSLIALYSSCHQSGVLVKTNIFLRQLFWIAIGLAIMFMFSYIDYRKLWDFSWPFYIFILFSLILVLFLGRTRLGAQRWLAIGLLNFQPSEFGKLAVIFVLARYFSQKSFGKLRISRGRFLWLDSLVFPFLIVLIPAFLVVIQPDLGTALMYIFVFLAMVYFAGTRLKYLASFLGILFLSFPVFWHLLRPYQKDRLLVFLNPDRDPLGAGYTIIQSKIAIGSGRIFGKGWLSGTQNQLNFLAERHTDFIFSTIGEEWGLIGGFVLIVLFFVLINRILKTIKLVNDPFAKNLCIGIASLIAFQFFINFAMTIGFMPVVGLPLPFISYGGSSLLSFLMLIGILLNINKSR